MLVLLFQVTCGSILFTSLTIIRTLQMWILTVTRRFTCLPSGPPPWSTSSWVFSFQSASASSSAFTCVVELILTTMCSHSNRIMRRRDMHKFPAEAVSSSVAHEPRPSTTICHCMTYTFLLYFNQSETCTVCKCSKDLSLLHRRAWKAYQNIEHREYVYCHRIYLVNWNLPYP